MDRTVTWENAVGFQDVIRRSTAMRVAREPNKYPRLEQLGHKAFDYLERTYCCSGQAFA